jgi:hypothetical protein
VANGPTKLMTFSVHEDGSVQAGTGCMTIDHYGP